MKSFYLAALAVSIAFLNVAQAQPIFTYSGVNFEPEQFVDLEKARQDFDGNVFIYFYKKGDPRHLAADSLFLSSDKISTLLNGKYASFAIDLQSDYARLLFSRLEPGGRADEPFVMLLNLEHETHQAIWSTWGAHPDDRMDTFQLDRMYWKLWNFADHGSTLPKEG